jgi:hypothetical protein
VGWSYTNRASDLGFQHEKQSIHSSTLHRTGGVDRKITDRPGLDPVLSWSQGRNGERPRGVEGDDCGIECRRCGLGLNYEGWTGTKGLAVLPGHNGPYESTVVRIRSSSGQWESGPSGASATED